MAEVQRIYPEGRTALINWIETHFHEIGSYVFVCRKGDDSVTVIHDVESGVEGVGLVALAQDSMCASLRAGEFKARGS